MTLSIFVSTLLGVAAGYPLMKLELKSAQRLQAYKGVEIFSQSLCIATCALPFFLYSFPAAIIIVGLMAVASFRKTLAFIIFVGAEGYLMGGVSGLVTSLFCPGSLLIPIAIIFAMLRNRSGSRQYTSLGISERKPVSQEMETIPKDQISLRKTALYCSVFVLLMEFNISTLDIGAIQAIYRMEQALPRLVESAKRDHYGLEEALKSYRKSALPFEIEILRDKFQSGWNDIENTYNGPNYEVAELTAIILEMGEAKSLRLLGENQKKALRAAANHYSNPANIIAIEELANLRAMPELVSGLQGSNNQKVMESLLKLRPNETIPVIMEWQANHEHLLYNSENESYSASELNYCKEFAKYGEKAVPELIPYLGDDSKKVTTLATNILREIGAPAVPELKKMLSSNNFLVVNNSAYILGMLGEKSAAQILIEKIYKEEDDDGTLGEALSYISDERATQFFISDYQAWKELPENSKKWEELSNDQVYEEYIARTRTSLAQAYLYKSAGKSKTLEYRKRLIDLLCTHFWKETSKRRMSDWIQIMQDTAMEQSQLAANELRKMDDTVVLPFLREADARGHKSGTVIDECEIHKAIAALSKK